MAAVGMVVVSTVVVVTDMVVALEGLVAVLAAMEALAEAVAAMGDKTGNPCANTWPDHRNMHLAQQWRMIRHPCTAHRAQARFASLRSTAHMEVSPEPLTQAGSACLLPAEDRGHKQSLRRKWRPHCHSSAGGMELAAAPAERASLVAVQVIAASWEGREEAKAVAPTVGSLVAAAELQVTVVPRGKVGWLVTGCSRCGDKRPQVHTEGYSSWCRTRRRLGSALRDTHRGR